MKTNGFMRILTVVSLLMLCMLCVCSAAVSVDDVASVVGPQVKLTAKVTDIEATSYQWYKCDDAQGTNPVAIDGATSAVYTTPYLDVAGTSYYMVKVNDSESAVAKVTATMPTEPVVVKFNNEADLEYWTGISDKKCITYNGNKVFSYFAAADGVTYLSNDLFSDMYIQGYPYVVIGAYYPEQITNTADIYLGTDRVPAEEKPSGFTASFSSMHTLCGGELSKTVVNVETRDYFTYNGNTIAHKGKAGGDGFGGFDKWMGKITSFRLDFGNSNAGKAVHIDYLGFFPTEEMALAYKGEMPNDAEAKSIIAAVDAEEISISYENGATKADADKYIAGLIEEITADAVDDIKASGISNVTVKVIDTKHVPGATSKESGEYTFTVDVLVGDKALRRTDLQKTYTVVVEGKPVTDVFLEDMEVAIGASATLTPEIKNITAESYQWYTCDNANGDNPVAITGATSESYTTPVFEAFGNHYYMLTVNGSESGVSAITVGMPTEPVVFMFNNEKDLGNWGANEKGMAVVEGKNVFTYIAEDGDASTSFENLAGYNDFYLQGYPYYVLSAEYPDEGYETVAFDIYFGTDGYDAEYRKANHGFNFSVVGVRPAVKSGLCKTIINAVTGEYESYCDGVLVNGGKGSNDGFKDFSSVIGKFASLRVDFINSVNTINNTGFRCNVEYLGFFPTKEMALAYNGEMSNDDNADAIIEAIDAAYEDGDLNVAYETASSEADVDAYIKALINEIANENANDVQTVVTIKDTEYKAGETIYDDGSYKFTVDVLVGGKPFNRSSTIKEYTVVLLGKSMGKVYIPDTTVAVGASATLTARLNGITGESYQWYNVSDAEGTNPDKIEGANAITYNTGYLNASGTYYYKLVVNGTESAIAKVIVDMPTEPVVLMFNNSADLAYWSAGTTKKLVNIDGKTAFAYTPNSDDGVTKFDTLSKYNDFYLQGYPYFVVSASYPNHSNLTFDIYIGADGYDAEYRKNHYNFNFSVSGVKPPVDSGFCKTVISAKDGSFKSYNAKGVVVAEGKGSPDGFKDYTTLIGKLAALRVDFSNQNKDKECYIEYLGFFPTEEMAIAYNGKMPEDASAKLLTDAVEAAEANGDFSLRFSESEKEGAVAEKAAAKVTALTADTVAELKKQYNTVEFKIANEEYVRPAPYGMGTYTFDAQALVGDKVFGRSLVSTKVTMELGEKPAPVVMKFDSQAKVTAATVTSVDSKTFVAKGTAIAGTDKTEDRSFMRLYYSTGKDSNYNNFYTQTGKTFNFQDYPYMKISYRRNIAPGSGERMMIYAERDKPSFFIDGLTGSNTNPYWEQMIVDMRAPGTNSITFYQEAAGTTSYGTLTPYNKERNWSDAIVEDDIPLQIRLTRYGTVERTIDYEYIAFFASKDEAMMFPRELPNNSSYDVETLTAKNSFAAAAGVISKAQAEQAAADYLKNFVFATKANIDYENAVFTAPSSSAPGSYVYDVWFGTERKDEFTVTVTMTMAQLPKPVIMYADSTAVLSSVKADNASLKLEDGVIKMKVSNPANDDGFFLLTKHPGSMPTFKASTLPYLKMRYTISGITKDTSGNPVNPATVQAQFFIWFNESFSQVPYKSYFPYNSNFEDGDEIELIVDMSYVTAENKSKPGIWVRNITKGETEYTAKTFAGGYRNEDGSTNTAPNSTGKAIRNSNSSFKEVRLNLARVKNLNRSAEFVYAGYFASLDEAKAFDSDKAITERLQAAENKLRALSTSDVVIPWAEVAKEKTEISDSKATLNPDGTFDTSGVKTQTVTAMMGLRQWINNYIGAEGNVEITNYVPATTTTKGSITFSMDLESGYQKRTVNNVTASFSEKPDDYIVWRFNDPAVLSKASFNATKNRVKVEDNVVKIDHNNPIDSGNFIITVKPSDFGQETFNFESHSYVLMKYKRIGDISPAGFTFTNTAGQSGNIGNVGWGWYSDDWYYTLYDTNIRDKKTPHSYNYNIDTSTLEDVYYHRSYAAPTAAPFKGDVKSISLDFGGRWFADRAMEIEFIAFFPSMADARNYVQNIEALEDARSDAVFDMAGYTADTVSYYDGNTQQTAEAKAKAIIEDKISAPNVDVAVNTVSYTAPGEADGSYVFNAVVTLDGEHVYTTENITLTIGKDVDSSPVVYKFTNPRFIQTVNGASEEYDFFGMTLTGNYFVLEVGADKSNVVAEVYNTLKLDAAFEGGFTAVINNSEEIVYEGDADGAVYLDLGEFAGNIDTVKVQFNNAGAKVRAIGFFADNAAAEAYDFNEIPAALAAAVASLGGSHSYTYQQSKTISDVYAHSNDGYIRGLIDNSDIIVADVEVTKYEHSTPTELGYAEVTATLGYGDKTATQYTTVTYPVTLAKDEEVITATPKSIGHEFLGYDVITANNNFASAPNTVEFNIMVAAKQLTGTVPVFTNGSANINLVDGKIVVNGALTSSSALKADTWTHVAITSDGKIYLDGALDASGSAVSFYTSAPVIGGGTSAGKGFIGHLLDLRFWNDVRTAEEIAANKNTRTDSDGLIANWMLNADNYKWLEYFDSSANNNTATFKSYGWYKMEAGWQGDYSFIHYGDTQSHFAIAPRSYKRIPDVFEWIGNNVEKYNIAHVSILGDATQNNTDFEWGVIREAHRFIDGKTTYHLPLGNHDYPSPSGGVGAEIRDTTNYREAFPYDEYVAIYGPDGMNTFGGTFRDEKDLTNMYNLVSVDGVDYIFFSLEYGPRDAVLEWVGEILTKYPERQAIISTHCYFSMDGTLTTGNSTINREFSDGNEGLAMYQKLVTKYPNIIIVDCGHSQGDDSKQHPHQRGSSYKDSPTADDFGNDVVQILSDASAYALEYLKNDVAFGADEGLIFVMMFEDNGRTMHTYVYSPLHDAFFRSVNEQTHTIKEIKAQPSLNVVGTELREQTTQETLGMRFKMTLSKSFANFEDEVKVQGYGVVVVPEDVMEEGMEVTADMLKGTENAKYVKVEECSDTIFYEDDERTDFTVVIHSIPTNDGGEAYARQFKARAYVDYTVNGGEVQRLYSFKTLTCSMNSLVND